MAVTNAQLLAEIGKIHRRIDQIESKLDAALDSATGYVPVAIRTLNTRLGEIEPASAPQRPATH